MIQLFQDLEDLVSLIAVESCIILNQSGCFACCLEETLMGWSPSPVFTVLLIPNGADLTRRKIQLAQDVPVADAVQPRPGNPSAKVRLGFLVGPPVGILRNTWWLWPSTGR